MYGCRYYYTKYSTSTSYCFADRHWQWCWYRKLEPPFIFKQEQRLLKGTKDACKYIKESRTDAACAPATSQPATILVLP